MTYRTKRAAYPQTGSCLSTCYTQEALLNGRAKGYVLAQASSATRTLRLRQFSFHEQEIMPDVDRQRDQIGRGGLGIAPTPTKPFLGLPGALKRMFHREILLLTEVEQTGRTV